MFSKSFQVVVGQKRAFFVFIHFHGGEFIEIIVIPNHRVFGRAGIAQSV